MAAWRKMRMSVAGRALFGAGIWMGWIAQAALAQDPSPPAGMLDTMSDPKRWSVYKDERVIKVDVSAAEAKNGKAISVSYEMGDGAWFGLVNAIDQDLTGYKGVRFTYCGQGNANSLEFKLEDSDGSVFGKILETKSNIGSLTVVEIPFADLSYWWGGDNKLAWDHLHNVHFAVSKKGGQDKGGAGGVNISQMEFYK
jgi:carbohydrate binding protein with CBM11 domain